MPAEPPRRPPLDAERLRGLGVEVVEEAGSTNALVAQRAWAGAPEGVAVVAEHQTAGRGRLDRTWVAPPRSGLTFSLLLRPTAPTAAWPWLPLLAGCAVARALAAHGFAAGLKWPNDVLLDDRKVAGLLVERVDTPARPAAVVGVGLNVDMTHDELPVPQATSLALAGGGPVPDRTELLIDVLDRLRRTYDGWQGGDRSGPAASYAAVCTTLGREVRVELPTGEVLTGTATGVDTSGRLLVENGGGTTAVSAGDVVHVRPA